MHPGPRPRRLFAGLAVAVTLAVALASLPAGADHNVQHTLEQKQREQQQTEQQLQTQRAALQDLENKAAAAQRAHSEALAQLESARAELDRISGQVQQVTRDIAATEAELQAVEAQFSAQKARLQARVLSLYMDSRVEYLDVLFGSTSFTDFLDRFELLQTVVRHDVDLMRQVRETREQAEATRTALAVSREQWQQLEELARRQRDALTVKVQEVDRYRGQLEYDADQVRQALDALEEASRRLIKEIRELEELVARELSGLKLSFPVTPVTITDNFGMRLHPILGDYRPHWGVDFAANYGQPVRASAPGTVIIAGWQGAFGNAVVISHGKLGANTISTLYAHNTELLVAVGQEVERGQVIARAGSTGWSTGPHVHLEVRVNGQPVDPMEWLSRD